MSIARGILLVLGLGLALFQSQEVQSQELRFRLEEATIADVHRAIQQGQLTCRGLVEAYVDRAKAYNGVNNRLVTRDGAPIPPAPGTVRAGAPLKFPTETVAISSLLPDFDQYVGPPIEFGRMEPTASDPTVQQQYGMTVGSSRAGQVNALGTINIRGERSVTCKGERDRHPSSGALPPGYDPTFVLSADKKRYIATNNNTPTTLPAPGLPFSFVFRAEPGMEDLILKAASAYEAASKRRVPPPAFGPRLSSEP